MLAVHHGRVNLYAAVDRPRVHHDAVGLGPCQPLWRKAVTPEKLKLARPDAIVMHPGPINRGVEIDSAVVDGIQSVILPQVTFGIAVRMAVMSIVAGSVSSALADRSTA